MKALTRCALALILAGLSAVTLYAGPAPVSRDGDLSKEVASVAPPPCDWTGFYSGVSIGGQFGHSEDKDLDNYNFPDRPWGYHEAGIVTGEQFGFNWQRHWLVLGAEIDSGYMDLRGSGVEPGAPQDTFGKSRSDLYATVRGRIGIAVNCWLIYATGGGIGVNYTTQVIDTSFTPAGDDAIDAHKEKLNFGYTFGGGVERMFHMWGHRWSIKTEYLYFNLDDQTFGAVSANRFGPYGWRAETEGHIVRAGLNYHF